MKCSSMDTFQSQEATGEGYVIIEKGREQRRGDATQRRDTNVKARTHRDEFRARYSPTFNAS